MAVMLEELAIDHGDVVIEVSHVTWARPLRVH
jgi:hypothetical protein